MRRQKGMATEPADKPAADGSVFSEEHEVIGAPLTPPPATAERQRFCQACFQWKGAENFGRTHPDRCWHCVRNPKRPPRANQMVMPDGTPLGGML
jgi:hypothetical protein